MKDNQREPFSQSTLRRITTMTARYPRLTEYLCTRDPQIFAELCVAPSNVGEAIAWWVWLVLFLVP